MSNPTDATSEAGSNGSGVGADEIPVTRHAYLKLEDELDALRTVRRRQVAEELRDALAISGDYADNSEYLDARLHQETVERRIAQLERKLECARVIEVDEVETDAITIGSRVVVEDETSGEQDDLELVGLAEIAAAGATVVSLQSPVGRSIVGKKAGDHVEVETPSGRRTLLIREVKPPSRASAADGRGRSTVS